MYLDSKMNEEDLLFSPPMSVGRPSKAFLAARTARQAARLAAGNVKSPGYAKVIEWISEAWSELDAGMISSSFQRCGITSRNIADYSNQLRHFMRTTELVDDVVQQDDFHDDDGAFGGGGDDWDAQTETLLDSESDIDENEE